MFARRCFCLRNRVQPLATVRDEVAMAVPIWGVLQKWSLLEVSNVA